MGDEIYLIKKDDVFTGFELPKPGIPLLLPELGIEIHVLNVVTAGQREKKPKPWKNPEVSADPSLPPGIEKRKPGRPKGSSKKKQANGDDAPPVEVEPIPQFAPPVPFPPPAEDIEDKDDEFSST